MTASCRAAAVLAMGGEKRRRPGGYVSEGPSESSVNIDDTEDEVLQSALPGLERFYEKMAAKAQLPSHPNPGASSSWVLSMARSYRRLSTQKRTRGRLKGVLQPTGRGVFAGPSEHSLGWASSTDDSGYEAGYETDADESELSEWESGNSRRQGQKRKLEVLVNLTKQMSFSEALPRAGSGCPTSAAAAVAANDENNGTASWPMPPPLKTPRALGTQRIGLPQTLPSRSSLHKVPASSQGGGSGISGGMAASSSGLTVTTGPTGSSPLRRSQIPSTAAALPASTMPASAAVVADGICRQGPADMTVASARSNPLLRLAGGPGSWWTFGTDKQQQQAMLSQDATTTLNELQDSAMPPAA